MNWHEAKEEFTPRHRAAQAFAIERMFNDAVHDSHVQARRQYFQAIYKSFQLQE